MIKNPVYPFMVDKGKFDKDKFVDVPKIELHPQSTLRFCISVDYGTVNPCSMGLWCLFGGDWYRIAESYFDSRKAGFQKTDEEHYSRLCALAGNRHICFVIVDPSAASFIEVIKRHKKFNVIPATNDLNQGLYDVSYLLQTGRIKICKNCEITKREFAQYEFDDNFKPIKQNDHAMDDIRYFVSTLFRTIGVNKMCEYCHCIGNNHDPMCPNYEEPKGALHLTCAVCDCLLWEDEPTEWLAFTDNDNTDYVCNDCLRDYLIDKNICD